MLPEKIKELKKMIINDAIIVEEMINKSVQGLTGKNADLLNSVIEKSEKQVNQLEVEIDEKCINTIALFSPEAKDLRIILMILKMNNDFERIGDLAVNIAESALFLIERPEVKKVIDIPQMTKETVGMLHDSISAFINEDTKLAIDVVKRDDIVDGLKNRIIRELAAYMGEKAEVIERALCLIKIAQNLERIADLSTNICEDVMYIARGKVIKHHYDEQ